MPTVTRREWLGRAVLFGAAVGWIDAVDAQINFLGKGNMRPAKGTIQFWLRSKPGKNIWNDGLDHWFISARAVGGDLQLRKDAENRLRLEWGRTDVMDLRAAQGLDPGPEVNRALAVPVSDLEPQEWHHLAISWDDRAGLLWLAIDRRLRSLRLGAPMEIDDFYILFLGSSHEAGYDQRDGHKPLWLVSTAGAIFDELKVSDVSLPEMLSLRSAANPLEEGFAIRVQDAVRKHLDLIAANRYMTLATADAAGRPWVSPVWFAPDDDGFLWISRPESRHSRNLSERPELALVILAHTHRPRLESLPGGRMYLNPGAWLDARGRRRYLYADFCRGEIRSLVPRLDGARDERRLGLLGGRMAHSGPGVPVGAHRPQGAVRNQGRRSDHLKGSGQDRGAGAVVPGELDGPGARKC